MKPLKIFDEYIKLGVVQIQSRDISRSQSLIKEAQESYNFLQQIIEKIGILNENANDIIKMSYDILMSEIKPLTLVSGYNLSSLISEHPKNKCLSQTTPFKVWWHIVFLITKNYLN